MGHANLGAALAGTVLGLAALLRRESAVPLVPSKALAIDPTDVGRVLKVGVPSGAEQLQDQQTAIQSGDKEHSQDELADDFRNWDPSRDRRNTAVSLKWVSHCRSHAPHQCCDCQAEHDGQAYPLCSPTLHTLNSSRDEYAVTEHNRRGVARSRD